MSESPHSPHSTLGGTLVMDSASRAHHRHTGTPRPCPIQSAQSRPVRLVGTRRVCVCVLYQQVPRSPSLFLSFSLIHNTFNPSFPPKPPKHLNHNGERECRPTQCCFSRAQCATLLVVAHLPAVVVVLTPRQLFEKAEGFLQSEQGQKLASQYGGQISESCS